MWGVCICDLSARPEEWRFVRAEYIRRYPSSGLRATIGEIVRVSNTSV